MMVGNGILSVKLRLWLHQGVLDGVRDMADDGAFVSQVETIRTEVVEGPGKRAKAAPTAVIDLTTSSTGHGLVR